MSPKKEKKAKTKSKPKKEKVKIRTENINLYYEYGNVQILKDVTFSIPENTITAIIGPSGCGKTSLLRVFNRMNDLRDSKTEGNVYLNDTPIYGEGSNAVLVRQKIGMVFQKPNPFPLSVFDNVAFAPRRCYRIKKKEKLLEIAENCLTQVDLWDELKDDLKKNALSLTPEQQQRLCIARTLAGDPEVILFDESCSTLDPKATEKVEVLMRDLSKERTIIIVTHNMEQAKRVSDLSAFMMIESDKIGRLVEYGKTSEIFSNPKDKRTEDYINGRFG